MGSINKLKQKRGITHESKNTQELAEEVSKELVYRVRNKKRNWVLMHNVATFEDLRTAYEYAEKLMVEVMFLLRANTRVDQDLLWLLNFGLEASVVPNEGTYGLSVSFEKRRGEVRHGRQDANMKRNGGSYSYLAMKPEED